MKKSMNKFLSVLLIILITLAFTNFVYADEFDNNPFIEMDKARDESLTKAANKFKSSLSSDLSLEEIKQYEMKLLESTIDKNRYIVKFKDSVSMDKIYETVSLYEYKIIGESVHRTFLLYLDDIEYNEYANSDLIEFIETDELKTSHVIPSDTYYDLQWAIPALNLPLAWDIETGSNDVFVAVIDSGIYREHPDLVNTDIRLGWDYIFDDNCDWDPRGHGTNVTGIIGAQTNNNVGIAGTNWNVAIIPLRVVYSDGTIYNSDVVQAIYDAGYLGCDVINLSLGGPTYSSAEQSAIDYAVSMGSIIVASAGNDGNSAYSYPASYNNVVSVGSIDSDFNRSSFSQYNIKVDVTAPGSDIVTTSYWYYQDYDYIYASGTSFSAPYVSGIAALMSAAKPTIDAYEFMDIIKNTSTDLGTTGFDVYYGYGLINAYSCLLNVAGPLPHKVLYDGNGNIGGTVPVDNNLYLPNANVTVLDNVGALEKTGYTFAGWNTAADGKGTIYKAGSTFTMGEVDKVLYAMWIDVKPIEDFVTRYYQLCLNRDPDPVGLQFWVNKLLLGESTAADVVKEFLLSSEFVNKNVSDDEYLNIMYKTFFNRAADAGGKAYWQNHLDNGMSRMFVLANFVNSSEFNEVCQSYNIVRGKIYLTAPADLYPKITAYVNRFYVLCMGRNPDADGLNYWVNNLATGKSTGADISKGFIFSSEFEEKHPLNTDYMEVMYRVFFNREPDAGGMNFWLNKLETGTSRKEVLKGFVYSSEFAEICSEYGILVGTV